MALRRYLLALSLCALTSALSGTAALGWPHPSEHCQASQYGVGDGYHGKRGANGKIFNTYARHPFTVAHKTLPFGTLVYITNLKNGITITAEVTDRGPFIKGRCVDLGRAGADALGMGGTAKVKVERAPR